jgi:hypothetical protein
MKQYIAEENEKAEKLKTKSSTIIKSKRFFGQVFVECNTTD